MGKKMTGAELVAFARSKIGTPYVYGMKGSKLTKEKYDALKKQYGSMVWDSDAKKIGKICVDCSGLISWACGVTRGSAQWKACATKVYPISEYKKMPIGAMVWCNGHIGIYNGNGGYIAADGSAYGVREAPLSKNHFTHFLLDENIFDYEADKEKDDAEMIEKGTIIVDDKKYTVEIVRKDGTTYIKTRDIANVLGMDVSSQGKVPVLKRK